MKTRVYVGTTEGPVAIERIIREAAPNSAMCIGRSTRAASASAGYEAFVKQPSGVIEREFGPYPPGAFRLDVSADIGDGDSWQLGVFVAHALAVQGRLAEYHEDADAALWLTGEVANDLEVRAVGHVPDKIRASRAELETLAARGIATTMIVPEANRDHLERASLPPAIARVAVARTDAALEAAGLAQPSKLLDERGTEVAVAPPGGRAVRARTRRWAYGTSAVLVLAGAAVAFPIAQRMFDRTAAGSAGPGQTSASTKIRGRRDAGEDGNPAGTTGGTSAPESAENTLKRPPLPEIRLVIRERRAPSGATCASVHLHRVEAAKVEVRRAAPDRFAASRHEGLCGLEFAVVNEGAPAYVAAFTTMVSGGFLDTGAPPESLRGESLVDGEAAWAVDIARRLDGPIEYRLLAVAAASPVSDAARKLRAGGEPIVETPALERKGMAVVAARHRVDP